MSKNKLPESYVRLKQYALLVEDICKDIDLRGFGYDPGVSFYSESGHSLELPEWFLKRLFEYMSAQQSVQPTCSTCGAKLRSGDIWWNECERCHSKIASR